MESDRITCLPDHLIDKILSHLPIRDAGRTSVLSSKWRNKWSTLPDLVFHRKCVSTAAFEDLSIINSKFIRIIDHVLLLHSGPINKFKLSESCYDIVGVNFVADMDRWILHLTGRSIKEFVLKILMEQPYKIPWCLFSWQTLRRLKLYYCCLKPPITFEGFRNLESLELKLVTVAQNAFENLISGCPRLERLKLIKVDGLTQFNIHAPNLKFFYFVGEFEDISFENSFQLTNVLVTLNVYLYPQSNQRRLHGCSSNLVKLFDHRPHIKSLVIADYFLKYLAAGVIPVKLHSPFMNLLSLGLNINFTDLKEISVVLCLLKSSPNVRKFVMFALKKEQTGLLSPASYCWEDIFSEPNVPLGVRYVIIKDISGTKFELDFIKFLLLYSPLLKRMTAKPTPNAKPELMTELISFKRASSHAEVVYHRKDSA
ncbi:unnamed protein product [Lathyrus sativus]|nr:unnamed protein product [Lathyrus sativus]